MKKVICKICKKEVYESCATPIVDWDESEGGREYICDDCQEEGR